ncbi:MAG: PQQ-binding-like beta-propeller repeat protein [Sandaracinaceae bacterium]|nr:PQQ-binding-like beta-propeller repeat protein [Sandaracinaceae bacterium]
MRIAIVHALGALSLLCACGGGASGFAPIYPDNEPSHVEEVVRRLRAAAPAPGDPVVVGLAEGQLYAYDLRAGRERWRQPVAEPRGAPLLAGALVILHEGDRVVARRLADGRRAFDVGDERYHLVGAAGEGATAAFVLSTTGGVGARSRLFVVSGEAIAHRVALEGLIGAPAVAAGMVFVAWGNQNVSVLDAASGAELARLRTRAGVVAGARVEGGELFFGQAGLGRLGAGLRGDTAEQAGWVQPRLPTLPGAPALLRNAYEPPPAPASATHRIAIVWAGERGDGPVRFVDDTLYLTFYRLVFGLDPSDLSVRWVQQIDADAVGGAARAGGVVVADAAGGLTYLAASNGRVQWTASTGATPSVAAIRLGDFAPSGAPGPDPGFLAEQLLAAAQNPDARLVPGRAFAVRALAAQPDPAVTGHLVVLCDDRTLPAALRDAGCEALATRTTGNDAVVRALARRASFLEDTTPPPVGPLASAAARMSERRAVPLLVAHLRDADTPLADLPALAAALAALGDRAAVQPLRDYLWLYHADGDEPALVAALGAVARALVALDGPPGLEAVRELLEAPFTAAPARAAIAAALEAAAAAE